MGNTSELLNKAFADKFIRDNYLALSTKFRVIDSRISEKGVSSLDKLNDTCLGLYHLTIEYTTYSEFELMANKKFKNVILKIKENSNSTKDNKCTKHTYRDKSGLE